MLRIKAVVAALALTLASMLALAAPASSKTLRIGVPALPSLGLNPMTVANTPALYTFAALFDALTSVDNGGVAKPQLALSWEAKDPRTWIFKLRPDVKFSNGEPFNADTAVYFANYLQHEGAGLATAAELGPIKARAIDSLTLEITTPEPDPFLPQEMSLLRFMAPAYFQKVGMAGTVSQAVGTGPFVLSTVEAGRLLLKASTASWHKPLLDTLEIVAAPEPAARVQALLSDRIDIAFQLGPDDLSAVEGAGMRMSVQPEPAVIVLEFINTKPSPLRDLRVRQALNYAVNKDEIVATILAGRALPASQPAPSIAFGYDPTLKPYPYDPARAKALLAEAGYPNGFKFIAEAFGGNSTYSLLVYEKVAADLAKVGVTMDMQVIPAPKYARGIYQGEWDGTAVGIDYSSTPSLDALRGFRRHSCLWVKPWYCDRSLMPLLNEALGTFDLDRRRELTHQVIRHQRDQASGIFLHEQPRFDGLNPRVKNYAIKVGYIAYDSIDIEEK